MPSRTDRQPRMGLALLVGAVALIVVACGGTASPTPSATGTPTAAAPTASPVASVAVTPEPSDAATPAPPVPGVDPAEDLTIAAPYEFAPLNPTLEEQLRTSMTASLGSMASVVEVGAREVRMNGASSGFLIAMRMPGVPGTEDPSFLDSIASGAAGSSGGQIEEREIAGETVHVVVSPAATFGVFRVGETFVFAYGSSDTDMTGIVTALLEANG